MQQPFSFDRASAERSLTDPDGALWPVNAYSDADELDSLVQAALDSGAIARPNRRARLYIYPLSLCEPDPVLVYDPGHGRAFLGHALKLRDREDESPSTSPCACSTTLTAEAGDRGAARPGRPAAPARLALSGHRRTAGPPRSGSTAPSSSTSWSASQRTRRSVSPSTKCRPARAATRAAARSASTAPRQTSI